MEDFYTDEPIDWKGSLSPAGLSPALSKGEGEEPTEPPLEPPLGMVSPSPSERARERPVRESHVDTSLAHLLSMIRHQPWQITRAKSFYEQAKLMEDYEDDAEIVGYMNYFPTYRDMTVEQMRSYFTIRKMWRQGKFPDVSLSYIFVYIYETLMQIGVDNPEEGYEILQELLAAYQPSIPKLERYLTPWTRDYVVYYNLEAHFKDVFAEENRHDAIAAQLANYEELDDRTLVDTICSISKYDIRKAALFKKQPDKALRCTAWVLRRIIPVIEKESHHHIETYCLGKKTKRQVTMFSNAVFYDPKPVRKAEIFLAPRHRYVCQGGLWSKDFFIDNSSRVKSVFGNLLHETDRQLRIALGVKPAIGVQPLARLFGQSIEAAIAGWLAEERKAEAAREAERRRVSIDFSKLGKIRSDAEVVMEKLEVPEEPIEPTEPITPIMPTMPIMPSEPTTPIKPTAPAEPKEATFLRLLLSGGDWKQYLRDIHLPEGVMVENINNKAMDEIGDIVLEDDGSGLHVIEDYRDDVKDLFDIDE